MINLTESGQHIEVVNSEGLKVYRLSVTLSTIHDTLHKLHVINDNNRTKEIIKPFKTHYPVNNRTGHKQWKVNKGRIDLMK